MGDIYEKELNGIDDIYNELARIVESGKEKIGDKITLVRMYSMAKEQNQSNKKEEVLSATLNDKWKVKSITFVDDNSGIIEYDKDIFKDGHTNWYSAFVDGKSLNNVWAHKEAADMHLLCKKNGEGEEAVRIMCKIIGINTEKY